TRESAAEAVVSQAINTMDFPAMIEAAYQDGVRVFVEIGPGASCTRLISKILAGRPHEAIAATAHPQGELAGMRQCLHQLVELGYPLDWSIVADQPQTVPTANSFNVPVRT